MKKLFFVLLASTSFGLLPPLAQSTKELRALLEDPRLYESLGSAERIKEIVRIENGYLVITENYALQVDITYRKGETKQIGPAQFDFTFCHSPILTGGLRPGS